MDAIEIFRTEWSVVAQAPWSFIAVLAVAVSISWLILSWRYVGMIENLRERLSLRDDLLNSLRRAADSAPTAEAAGVAMRTELDKRRPDNIEDMLLGNRWELNFNPSSSKGRKLITFLPKGIVGEGRNSNEYNWTFDGNRLSLSREDGSLQNRFKFDRESNKFLCTNDASAKGIVNQEIYLA